jgi:hypothetical protein
MQHGQPANTMSNICWDANPLKCVDWKKLHEQTQVHTHTRTYKHRRDKCFEKFLECIFWRDKPLKIWFQKRHHLCLVNYSSNLSAIKVTYIVSWKNNYVNKLLFLTLCTFRTKQKSKIINFCISAVLPTQKNSNHRYFSTNKFGLNQLNSSLKPIRHYFHRLFM